MCKIIPKEVSDVFFEEDAIEDFTQPNINFLYTPTPAIVATFFLPFQGDTAQDSAGLASGASVLVPSTNIPPSELGTTTQSQGSNSTNTPTSQQMHSTMATAVSSMLSAAMVSLASNIEVSVPGAPVPPGAGSGTQSQAGSGVPSTASVTAAQHIPFNLPPVPHFYTIMQLMGANQLSQAGNGSQSQAAVNAESVVNTIAQLITDSNEFWSQPPFGLSVPLQEGASVQSQAGNNSQAGPGVQTVANSAAQPFDVLIVPSQAGVSAPQTGNSVSPQTGNSVSPQTGNSVSPQTGNGVQPQAESSVQSATNIFSQLLTGSSGLSSEFQSQLLQDMSSIAGAQSQADIATQLLTASSQLLSQLPLTQPPNTTVHQSHMGTSMQSQAEPAAPLSEFPDSSATSVQSQSSIDVQLPSVLSQVTAATVPQTETSSGAQQTSSIDNLVPQILSLLSSTVESIAVPQESPEGFQPSPELLAQLDAELPSAL